MLLRFWWALSLATASEMLKSRMGSEEEEVEEGAVESSFLGLSWEASSSLVSLEVDLTRAGLGLAGARVSGLFSWHGEEGRGERALREDVDLGLRTTRAPATHPDSRCLSLPAPRIYTSTFLKGSEGGLVPPPGLQGHACRLLRFRSCAASLAPPM